MLGLYIDGRTDEQRDRIIEGQRWCIQAIEDHKHARCLVGHVVGGGAGWRALYNGWNVSVASLLPIGNRFDDLCRRFGMDRIVRCCKLRAAKGNAITLTAPLVRHG
jgi:hypothetical protein